MCMTLQLLEIEKKLGFCFLCFALFCISMFEKKTDKSLANASEKGLKGHNSSDI